MIQAATPPPPTYEELTWHAASSRIPRLRAMRQFVEDEVVIPEGKWRGTKLRIHRQPYGGLLFDAIDSGRWTRTAILGCVQAGKTLHGFVAPIMYHLFEHRETVICGLPTMDIAGDKWREEILPVILKSRYHNLIPTRGPGSRGGTGNLTSVTFTNGATLKFMTGGGGDETRSSFTARVVVVTEADKMDESGEASREADPVSQLEARTLSYDDTERRLYLECTVSIEQGCIWKEYHKGTASKIVCPCPHCGEYVTPEREHLQGWQVAESKIEARELTHFVCPSCAEPIDDAQRREMNQRAKLIHRGQEINAEGTISGEPPKTDTLGFRWSAFNNLFWSAGSIGAKEWDAARAENEEDALKELLQFYWALPAEPPQWDATPLDVDTLRRRTVKNLPRGIVPADTKFLTVMLDPGKRVGYWSAAAFWENSENSGCHWPTYSTIEIPSDGMGIERGMLAALRDFRDLMYKGLGWEGHAEVYVPDQVWIDASYRPDEICQFIRETKDSRFRPVMGRGEGQRFDRRYSQPKKTTTTIVRIGEGYFIEWMPAANRRVFMVYCNADYWKSTLHERLAQPQNTEGAVTFYHASSTEHITLAKHLTAERAQVEFVPGKGMVTKWIQERRANHYLDCGYNALAAGHLCGVRVTRPDIEPPPQTQQLPIRRITTPDGRPFLATQR